MLVKTFTSYIFTICDSGNGNGKKLSSTIIPNGKYAGFHFLKKQQHTNGARGNKESLQQNKQTQDIITGFRDEVHVVVVVVVVVV